METLASSEKEIGTLLENNINWIVVIQMELQEVI